MARGKMPPAAGPICTVRFGESIRPGPRASCYRLRFKREKTLERAARTVTPFLRCQVNTNFFSGTVYALGKKNPAAAGLNSAAQRGTNSPRSFGSADSRRNRIPSCTCPLQHWGQCTRSPSHKSICAPVPGPSLRFFPARTGALPSPPFAISRSRRSPYHVRVIHNKVMARSRGMHCRAFRT